MFPILFLSSFLSLFIFTGFIEHLVKPLFATWHDFFQTDLTQQLLCHVNSNFTSWSRQFISPLPSQKTERNYTGDHSRKKPFKSIEVKTNRKSKKVFGKNKCGCMTRRKTDPKVGLTLAIDVHFTHTAWHTLSFCICSSPTNYVHWMMHSQTLPPLQTHARTNKLAPRMCHLYHNVSHIELFHITEAIKLLPTGQSV